MLPRLSSRREYKFDEVSVHKAHGNLEAYSSVSIKLIGKPRELFCKLVYRVVVTRTKESCLAISSLSFVTYRIVEHLVQGFLRLLAAQ